MSSQAFHRTPCGHVREAAILEQFEPRTPESFDPVTQELYRLLSAIIHTQESDKHRIIELKLKMKSSHANDIARALVRVDLVLPDSG
jgi:hypothetical protein